MHKMRQKRDNEEDLGAEDSPTKRYFQTRKSEDQPGTSKDEREESQNPLELLTTELQQPRIDVQEIGKIIATGMLEKTLNDEILEELCKRLAKNFHSLSDINIFTLADELNRGVIDSRLVVIGNAFLWNLLKTSMSSVRDKFDHLHFKMSTAALNPASALKVDFSSPRVRAGQHLIVEETVFQKCDLLDVYNSVIFRKTGDLQAKTKQFIKAYLTRACQPKCAIWYYSLRQSGSSHKKWLQDIPIDVINTLLLFLLSLSGLGSIELEQNFEDLDPESSFLESLGDTDDVREIAFENLKSTREAMISKFRGCVTDVLNECREMPYNTVTQELMAPPRGKKIDMTDIVTWRQYENLIRNCHSDPSKENMEAKEDLDYKLMFTFPHRRRRSGKVDEDDIVIEIEK